MLHELIVTWFSRVNDWGYAGVFLLMAIESSIVPLPSEVVIPPAAFFTIGEHPSMSFAGVIVAGTAGSFCGAMVMYVLSRVLGRPIVLRWGKFVLVSPAKLEKAEHFLARYETGGVFFARLLPVVRHLIGIPAGIVRMSPGWYSAMTVAGSAVWCTVLAVFGRQVLGDEPQLMQDPDALRRVLVHKSLTIVVAVAVMTLLYFAVVRMTRKPEPVAAPPAG
ncbi:MAG: DedA family protein [Polyangiaceae bacterium]|jgi:membrane protein DedA with SNARE-associated domain